MSLSLHLTLFLMLLFGIPHTLKAEESFDAEPEDQVQAPQTQASQVQHPYFIEPQTYTVEQPAPAQPWNNQIQYQEPQVQLWDTQGQGFDYHPEFLDPCGFYRDYQFIATLLYLKPSVDQASFAITSTDNRFGGEVYPNGKRHILSTDYQPGFRAEALFNLCNETNFIDLRFTYFDANDSSSVTGSFLFDTVGFPGHGAQVPEDTTYNGTSRFHQHYQYYAGDATLNRVAFTLTPEDNITFLFGLQYIYVGFKQVLKSNGTFQSGGTQLLNNRLHQRSKFWGIGPQIGINYNYLLFPDDCCGGLAFNARARGALLCSRTNANLHYVTTRTGSVGVNLRNSGKLWRVNPTAEAQLALSYQLSCCNTQATLEVGYEFLWCQNCVDKITGYDVAFAGDSLDAYDSLSLQGPYISLNIAF